MEEEAEGTRADNLQFLQRKLCFFPFYYLLLLFSASCLHAYSTYAAINEKANIRTSNFQTNQNCLETKLHKISNQITQELNIPLKKEYIKKVNLTP